MTLACLMWTKAGVNVPEVRYDPHAEQVVTEVAKRGTAVNRASIAGKSPILPQPWGRHAGHIKTVVLEIGITHCSARRGLEDTVRGDLLYCSVGLERTHDVHHLNAALVCNPSEEILIGQEGNQRNEISRGAGAVIYVSRCCREDTHIVVVRIGVRIVNYPVHLPIASRRARLSEEPESSPRSSVQLSYIDSVCRIKCIVEIEGRWVEAREVGPAA